MGDRWIGEESQPMSTQGRFPSTDVMHPGIAPSERELPIGHTLCLGSRGEQAQLTGMPVRPSEPCLLPAETPCLMPAQTWARAAAMTKA